MRSGLLCPLLLVLLLSASTARALTFNVTWDSSVDTSFGSNAPALKSAFQYAINEYTTLYSDPIHVNLTVRGRSGSFLGISSENNHDNAHNPGWAKFQNALIADARTADDLTAVSPGGSASGPVPPSAPDILWTCSTAEEKALGLIPDDTVTQDGEILFSPDHTWTFDPNNRAVSGAFDFIGTAEHEISEVMGRIDATGGYYSLLDMFSFTGPGARDINYGPGDSISIDMGNTLLKTFNSSNGIGGDPRDWAAGTNDSYNAFSNPGVMNGLSYVDLRTMDVIGYDLTVPEPSTTTAIALALAAVGLSRHVRRDNETADKSAKSFA